MPFNSASYYRNKWRRDALAMLTKARKLKAEPLDEFKLRLYGPDYQRKHVESAVRQARSSWRLYLSQRTICELSSRAAPYRPEPWTTRESINA